ncbi:MAG: zinc ribbon domain-containing protein [Oleiphilaceae bacterium]|nr:zinc ribbon domain-containing protein [Oleiphilaceae bacterium]
MPIYEYACKSCGFEKDVLQKLSDAPLTTCPSCEQESFTKKISAAGFRLKGGGWYETDFKTGKKKNLAGENGASGKTSEGKTTEGKTGTSKKTESSAPAA